VEIAGSNPATPTKSHNMFDKLDDLEIGRNVLNEYKPLFLEDLLSNYKTIVKLPKFLYEDFKTILLSQERYEDMVILQKVEDVVYDISEDEYLEAVRKTLSNA
jgi:hypothetical protein